MAVKIDKDLIIPKDAIDNIIKANTLLQTTLNNIEKIALESAKIGENIKSAKSFQDVEKASREAAKSTNQLSLEEKELAKVQAQIERENAKLSDAYIEQVKVLKEVKQQQKDKLNQDKLAKDSIKEVASELKKLKDEYRALSKDERENTQTGKLLLKTIQDLDKEYKDLEKSIGTTQVNVGNYKKDVKEALNESGLLGGTIGGLSEGFSKASKTVKVFGSSAKAAIAATGIGLLLIAISSLITFFTKTEKGAQKLKVIMAGVGAVINVLVGYVAKLGEFLFKAFEDPKQAIKDLWQIIQENLINRFKAAVEVFAGLKDITIGTAKLIKEQIKGIFTDNDKNIQDAKDQIKDGAKAIKDNLVESFTGIDTDKIKEGFSNITSEIQRQIKEAANLAELEYRYRNLNRILDLQAEKLGYQKELQLRIADDDNKSFKDREKASLQAAKLIEEEGKLRISIAENNLQLINKQIELNKANGLQVQDLLDQQLEANKALMAAENALLLERQDASEQYLVIKRDEFEQELDNVLDVYDRRKSIIEKQITDDKLSFDERKKLLNDLKEADKRNEQEILKLYEEQTGKKLDLDRLTSESNIETLNNILENELNFNEIERNRLREVIVERQQYNQDIIDLEKELTASKTEETAKRIEAEKAANKAAIDSTKSTLDEAQNLFRENTLAYKAIALAKISIDTAQAISGLTANSETNPANAVTFGVAGALQFAAGLIRILGNIAQARSIIKAANFFKGVKNFEGGLAFVGEQGTELISTKNGLFLTPETSTLTNLPKGTDVYTHQETKEIFRNIGYSLPSVKEFKKVDKDNKLLSEFRNLAGIIKNKKNVSINIDRNGMKIIEGNGFVQRTRHDNYFRGLN